MDELKYFGQSAEEVRLAGAMPDIPVAVLTRDKRLLPTLENKRSMEDAWRELQADLVKSSTRAWQHVVKGSGHNIHLDAPQAVIDAVIKVRHSTATRAVPKVQ